MYWPFLGFSSIILEPLSCVLEWSLKVGHNSSSTFTLYGHPATHYSNLHLGISHSTVHASIPRPHGSSPYWFRKAFFAVSAITVSCSLSSWWFEPNGTLVSSVVETSVRTPLIGIRPLRFLHAEDNTCSCTWIVCAIGLWIMHSLLIIIIIIIIIIIMQ